MDKEEFYNDLFLQGKKGESFMFFDEMQKFGETIMLTDGKGETFTYADAEKYAQRLKPHLAKRSVVLCLCRNTVGSIAGYLAFLRLRAVPLLLDEKIDVLFLKQLVKTYQPEYLYVPADRRKEFLDVTVVAEEYGYCLIKTACASEQPMYEELALLLTTSGSTGSPKLVRQSYRNLESNAQSIVEYLEIDKRQRAITVLPMNYTYGLSVINSHVKAGATIVLTQESIVSPDFWELMRQEKVTSFVGVPFIYETLKKLRFFQMELPDLQYMTQAGGKLSYELQKEFTEYAIRTGKKFIVMYGQTEATARMSYLPFEKAQEKCGSMGIAIPGGRFSLIGVDGKEITAANVVGELVYEGDNVTLGYALCRADLAKGDERNRRLVTGDMTKRDEDGYYYIVGRKKRFLKLMGNRVNLDEVEQILKEQFPQVDIAAAGQDEHLVVYVTDKEVISDMEEYLQKKTHLNSHTGEIRYICKIPRNESGKILYKKLETE